MKSMLIAVGLLGASIAALLLTTGRKQPEQITAGSPELPQGSHAMG
ncbi:hypothetical protein [Flaviaesturariibacter aridisoli]|nr:hypothetical protein [Flaviaesturariibacter aridisoli]